VTAAETLQAKIDGLTEARQAFADKITAIDADVVRLQGYQQQLAANPDATALVEALWAEAQR